MASDYLRQQFNTHIFGSASYPKPNTLAIALCTTLPNHFDTGATIPEVANSGGYERQILNPSDANWSVVGGVVTNAQPISFPQATTDWGTVGYIVITDDVEWGSGNVLFFGKLDEAKHVTENEQLVVQTNGLIIKTD